MKTQVSAVAEAMRRNGGFATLRWLYEHALEVEGVRWKTKTPFASMRRIVQKSDLFFKVKPGLWALSEYRDRLPQDIRAMMQNPDDRTTKGAELSHSYYQGLALELGHLKGHQTYVPAQDGNRLCAGRPLREIADTTSIPEFTYDRVLRSVRMIDAIWFNSRGFPHSGACVNTRLARSLRVVLESGAGRVGSLDWSVGVYFRLGNIGRLRPAGSTTWPEPVPPLAPAPSGSASSGCALSLPI